VTQTRPLESVGPAIVFVVVNSVTGLGWAMVASTAAALFAVYRRHRRREAIGWLLPVVTVWIISRGVIGLATGSDDVYFGIGVLASIALALAAIGSVIIGKPVAGMLAPEVVHLEPEVISHPEYGRVFGRITLAWAALEIVTSVFELWLLGRTSANEFVILRTAIGWPLSFVMVTVAITYAHLWHQRTFGRPLTPRLDKGGAAPPAAEGVTGQPATPDAGSLPEVASRPEASSPPDTGSGPRPGPEDLQGDRPT
jgi:intracellular septation protein A